MKSMVGFIFFALIATSLAQNLPTGFKTCRKSNPQFHQCLSNAVESAVIQLAPGLRSMNIVPLEPLAVDKVSIGAAQGAVALKQEYRNIKLYGLTKGLRILNYKIDWKKNIIYSEAYNPQVDFTANYQMNGRVLLLPVTGSGKSNITMIDLKTIHKLYFQTYVQNDEMYMKINKFEIRFTPNKVILRFDNLFNGDNVLSKQMNAFLNQNSDSLFKELQGPYEESFGLVFGNIANQLFSRVPLKNIFLN